MTSWTENNQLHDISVVANSNCTQRPRLEKLRKKFDTAAICEFRPTLHEKFVNFVWKKFESLKKFEVWKKFGKKFEKTLRKIRGNIFFNE